MNEELALRYVMGLSVLATLATLFFCIVITPVILVIGFAGHFWTVWNGMAAHPFLGSLAIVTFMVLAMFWIWLMIKITGSLLQEQ